MVKWCGAWLERTRVGVLRTARPGLGWRASVFASWMAHSNSLSLVLFSSFIWVGCGVGVGNSPAFPQERVFSSPRPLQGCHLPLLFPSLSPIVSAPRSWAGGLGRSNPLSSSLCGSTGKGTFPWGWGKRR